MYTDENKNGPYSGQYITQNNFYMQGCAVATGEHGQATVNQYAEPHPAAHKADKSPFSYAWMTELGIPESLHRDLDFFRPFFRTGTEFREFSIRLMSCQSSLVLYALLADLIQEHILPEEVISTLDTMERVKRLVSHVDLPQPQSMKKTLDTAIRNRAHLKSSAKK